MQVILNLITLAVCLIMTFGFGFEYGYNEAMKTIVFEFKVMEEKEKAENPDELI